MHAGRRMKKVSWRTLSSVACLLVVGGCVGMQRKNSVRHRASYPCPRTAGRVTVDGSLDEAAWHGAQVIREFGIPVTHEAPRRETEARCSRRTRA